MFCFVVCVVSPFFYHVLKCLLICFSVLGVLPEHLSALGSLWERVMKLVLVGYSCSWRRCFVLAMATIRLMGYEGGSRWDW